MDNDFFFLVYRIYVGYTIGVFLSIWKIQYLDMKTTLSIGRFLDTFHVIKPRDWWSGVFSPHLEMSVKAIQSTDEWRFIGQAIIRVERERARKRERDSHPQLIDSSFVFLELCDWSKDTGWQVTSSIRQDALLCRRTFLGLYDCPLSLSLSLVLTPAPS